MSKALSPFAISRLWAEAFAADRFLAHFAASHYDKDFALQIGADMRRPPNSKDAPFIAIFPDSGESGPQKAELSAEIGLVVGICEEDIVERGSIKELLGLQRLDELCPLLEKAMREALPKARIQDISTEFEITQYPLCLALITVTVQESLPIGRR